MGINLPIATTLIPFSYNNEKEEGCTYNIVINGFPRLHYQSWNTPRKHTKPHLFAQIDLFPASNKRSKTYIDLIHRPILSNCTNNTERDFIREQVISRKLGR